MAKLKVSTAKPASVCPIRLMLYGARRRSKRLGVPCTITADDIEIPARCPVLGIRLKPSRGGTGGPSDNSPTLDRLVPSKGYVPGNVRVISNKANRIKSDATLKDLVAVAHYVSTHT